MTTARHEMRTDTSAAIAYGPRMSRPLLAIAAAVALVLLGMPAAADDEPRFHRTTPRGFFERDGEALVVGVPAGRAWLGSGRDRDAHARPYSRLRGEVP